MDVDRVREELRRLLADLEFDAGERGSVSGREKFARRRKIRRLNRILDRLEREGVATPSDREPAVDLQTDGATEATLVVAAPDPTVSVADRWVSVRTGDREQTVELELPFVPASRERWTNNGVTTVEFYA